MSVLPDSRLRVSSHTIMCDWEYVLPNGTSTTIRLELEPIFCFNCGTPSGYVPKDIISFVSWLCQPCSDKWGTEASLHTHSDQEFWDKVSHEMFTKYGKALTQQEICELAQQDKLSTGLQLLMRESPYKEFTPPSH